MDYDYVAVSTDNDSDDLVKFTIDDDAEEDYGGSNDVVGGGEGGPALSSRSADGSTVSTKRIVTEVAKTGDAASSAVLEV